MHELIFFMKFLFSADVVWELVGILLILVKRQIVFTRDRFS